MIRLLDPWDIGRGMSERKFPRVEGFSQRDFVTTNRSLEGNLRIKLGVDIMT